MGEFRGVALRRPSQSDLNLAAAVARSGVRSVRRSLRDRSVPRAIDLYVPARVEEYELRPLRLTDQESWTRSMRANESRMRPWWPPVDDWQKATDAVAFVDHYWAWRGRMRQGTGLPLVLTGPEGVLGEITLWNLSRGGHSGEAGIWMYPKISRRKFLPLWASFFDNCFGNLGLEFISSPVAVGNAGPLALIGILDAEKIATIPGGREVGGHAHDVDVYTLSRETWLRRRAELFAEFPWPRVSEALPAL